MICGDGSGEQIPYGPYGPRGWQDEYCEWSVLRNDRGQIVRIDFACENPEYWYALWRIDPQRVLELYRETLDQPRIALEDLQLTYNGLVVIDRFTRLPAYNPLNKYPKIREIALAAQWLVTGAQTVLGALFFFLYNDDIDRWPVWFLASLAVGPAFWAYLGVTAQGNVTGTDENGNQITTTEEI